MAERSNREAYLGTVAAELGLPPDLESDVLDELRDHVADATEALMAEGLDDARAEREALARLGSPDVLAEQLRRAHQTQRRLLAGAGGGVWTAISEGFYGLFFGWVFLALAAALAALVVFALVSLVGSGESPSWIDLSGSTAFAAIIWAFAANRAGRAALLVAAARSRRRVAVLALPIALAGSLFLACWGLAVENLSLDWPAVIAVLAIPIGFAIGALSAREGDAWKWRPRRTWRAFGLVAAGFAGIYLGAALLMPAATTRYGDESVDVQTRLRFDRIGPTAVDWPVTAGGIAQAAGRTVNESWEVDPTAIAGWHDLRVELWRAETEDGPVAADAIRPIAVHPVEAVDGAIEAFVDLPRFRDLGAVWVALTGVDSHGRRFQLADPSSIPAGFQGTVLDWLWAGDTPDS